MSKLNIDPKAFDSLKVLIANSLAQAASHQVDRLKGSLHIQTGRLVQSARQDPFCEIDKDSVTKKVRVGGTVEIGIYQEMGQLREVDYAIQEEVRHPQVRVTLPEYARDLKATFKI